ncbi:juvenile hormone esterase-like [Plodia interpunctella]|uniref:juvenile hormone esterase-like n=1 Tax=Plodia interpunctella TaxID=58824 RepID=UPI002367D81A|nr:juvenile hormone esterase-like [Plodia interpunctella]
MTISQGKLRGGICKTENGFQYYEFLGIPYAKPPIGELRFKNPEPPEKWDHERDATSISVQNIATQVDFVTGKIIGSEDCLYLNVYTPNLNSNLLPVIVFIHGGGFIHGNGTIKTENGPDFLVEHNVVVVTINYRLNIFGFMSLDIPEAPGNMGLKDQLKALKWVKTNISNFGGDVNNITLMGISAGAASTEYLMLSPLANGLFHKAIIRSGSALNHWAINYDIVKLTTKVAQLLGYEGAIQERKAIYEFLKTIPETQLIGASFQITETNVSNRVYFGFVPCIEKSFGNNDEILTTDPYKLLEEGNFSKIPVMRGFCNKEGSLMGMMKPIAMKNLIEKKDFMYHWSYNIDPDDREKYNKEFSESYLNNIKPDDEENKFA